MAPCPDCQPLAASGALAPVIEAEKIAPVQGVKPPPQIAGVAGIGALPITMGQMPAQSRAVDWGRVVALPPFQMFAAERMRNTSGKDSLEHAIDYVRAQGGGVDVFHAYCQWHADKNDWPGETPLGEAKNA